MSARTQGRLRSVNARLDALERHLGELHGQLAGGRSGLADAVGVVMRYPDWVRAIVDLVAQQSSSDEDLAREYAAILSDVVLKISFVEEWFAGASSLRISPSLSAAVEQGCIDLRLGPHQAVVAIGSPRNFETLPINLTDHIFSLSDDVPRPHDLPQRDFALIQVPRMEGGEALWWPVVLGHELAHLAVDKFGSARSSEFDKQLPWDELTGPRRQTLAKVENWATELLCDAFAVVRFGPAGSSALAEFLDGVGPSKQTDKDHPPTWLRVRLLSTAIGTVAPKLRAVMAPIREMATEAMPAFPSPDDRVLIQYLASLGSRYTELVRLWTPGEYVWKYRPTVLNGAVRDLASGVPPEERYGNLEATTADVINAGWAETCRDSPWPVGALVSKSVDNLAFLRLLPENAAATVSPSQRVARSGMLSGPAVVERMNRTGKGKLVVTPMPRRGIGASSIDVRLGSKFIVFQRTQTHSFRTAAPEADPRRMQRMAEFGWNEHFVLHPGELVLASTLEYFAFPDDLAATVITRSSYGRIGLMTATAVQVHPHYRGCLTLELVNHGQLPIELRPGERIAQLAFMIVDPPAPAPDPQSYDCPTGPRFSGTRHYPDELPPSQAASATQ
jgi:deoxycytidine triphosphate deaminase